jgi:energy-coupling factor transporter transmembrane protein EcfT
MHYNQDWMGYGFVGGLEAGVISALAGLLLFVVFHWAGRRNGWSFAPQVGWSLLLATILTASGDLSDLFYFNYAPLQSVPLLKLKLAQVHDPDSIGLRVVFELLGVALGIYLGWVLCNVSRNRGSGNLDK